MNATQNWFKTVKSPHLSLGRRRLAPMIEQVEDRCLMTGAAYGAIGNGFLAGSVLQDGNSGAGVSGVTIELFKSGSNNPLAVQSTDSNGQYLFTGLKPGNYVLKEVTPNGFTATGTNIQSQLNPASAVGNNTIDVTVVDPSKVFVNYGGVIPGEFGVVNDVVKGQAQANSVGPFADTLGTSAGATNLNSGFQTFCVNDLESLNFSGGQSYQAIPKPISQLTDGSSVISADHSGRIAYLFNHYGNSSLSNIQGAGLQLAIWELLYDQGNTPNFNSGAFQVTGPDLAFTDPATFNQIISQAKAFYNDSSGHHEQAVFLDAAAANCGQTQGLQSVLCEGSLDFDVHKAPCDNHGGCDSGGHDHGCDIGGGHGGSCDSGGGLTYGTPCAPSGSDHNGSCDANGSHSGSDCGNSGGHGQGGSCSPGSPNQGYSSDNHGNGCGSYR
jgi:SdrD B-like domain